MEARWLSLLLGPFGTVGFTALGFPRALTVATSVYVFFAFTLFVCTFCRSVLCFLARCIFSKNLGSTPLREL